MIVNTREDNAILCKEVIVLLSTTLLTFDGEPAGDGIPDFAGDVTGVFLGDPLGEVVEGSSSLPRREGGGRSVHEGTLGPPKAPYAIDP